MGKLLHINPLLHFPVGRPFEITDQYNGVKRGTWYYRDTFTGDLNGPYFNFDEAAFHLTKAQDKQ